jgi:hypothetical protein
MGEWPDVPQLIGHFSRSRIVKFGLSDASDEAGHARNRSGTITLPMRAVVTGASPCILAPE